MPVAEFQEIPTVLIRRLLSVAVLTTAALAAVPARAQIVERPIADVIGPNLTGLFYVWTEPGTPDVAAIDVFGRFALTAGINVGSTFEGSVIEQANADGTARVRVHLRARNVLMWTQADGLVTFGATHEQVKAGAVPAIGDAQLTYEFTNTAPGAPLPNLTATACERLAIIANAKGQFTANSGQPAGTPGRLQVVQRGLSVPGFVDNPGQDNSYPAELVNLIVTGPK